MSNQAESIATKLPPAGWYPDPNHPGMERWWGATAWGPEMRRAPKPRKKRTPWIIAGSIVAGLVLFVALVASAAQQGATQQAAPNIPDGYSGVINGVAWQWDNGDADTLCNGLTCGVVQVKTQTNCDEVYVEANLVDSAGNVIGFTNGVSGALTDGQTAKITMLYSNPEASTLKLTKLECN